MQIDLCCEDRSLNDECPRVQTILEAKILISRLERVVQGKFIAYLVKSWNTQAIKVLGRFESDQSLVE